jgi:hypothetical protein
MGLADALSMITFALSIIYVITINPQKTGKDGTGF